jgi:hypothetical protein
MGDVLAAADVLVHSSAGLTVLEAIIRGCPVVSYGFGYRHVRASNTALERFRLAQVARRPGDLEPAISRALETRLEPDPRFARRPSTASLILGNERRARTRPLWRLHTVRTATALAVSVVVAGWTLTAGASYSLVSHFAHIRPMTAVATGRPEVGILINTPGTQVTKVAGVLSSYGIHASFGLRRPSYPVVDRILSYGDQTLPSLPPGGLVRWMGARGQLRSLISSMGYHNHFLYESNGPSLGQWLVAHGAGGRLVAGAVRLQDSDDSLRALRPGQVVEVVVSDQSQVKPLLDKLTTELRSDHLAAVPVGRLIRDAGSSV